MNIRKAFNIFSLDLPVAQQKHKFGFFYTTNKTLYFRTRDEADFYRNKFHPHLSLNHLREFAVSNSGIESDDSKNCYLVRNVEYINDEKLFSSSLNEIIRQNPCSVIAVKMSFDKDSWFERRVSQYDYVKIVDDNTKFLFANGSDRWLVEPGQEIILTDVSAMMLQEKQILSLYKLG